MHLRNPEAVEPTKFLECLFEYFHSKYVYVSALLEKFYTIFSTLSLSLPPSLPTLLSSKLSH
jgi:hypothetical protein